MKQPISKLRSQRQIQAAAKEYEERVWHAQTMELLHQIECHGGEVPAEEAFARMMARVKRLEHKYGDTLEVDDYPDLMFLAGKFVCAALRPNRRVERPWVLAPGGVGAGAGRRG